MAIATAEWAQVTRSRVHQIPRESVRELYARAKISGHTPAQAFEHADVVHIKDLGIQIQERPVTELRVGDATKRYLWHLATKALIAIGVIISALFVAWVAALNLALFVENGTSLFHPLISVFVLAASVSLIVVAVVAIFTAQRYFRETVGSL